MEKLDLDWPILMKEKLDVLWKPNKSNPETSLVRWQIKQKKVQWVRANTRLRKAYTKCLAGMKTLTEQERQFLDLIKIISQNDWELAKPDYEEILRIIDPEGTFTHQNNEMLHFFITFMGYDMQVKKIKSMLTVSEAL